MGHVRGMYNDVHAGVDNLQAYPVRRKTRPSGQGYKARFST